MGVEGGGIGAGRARRARGGGLRRDATRRACSFRLAPGCTLHDAIQRLGPIRRGRVGVPRGRGRRNDLRLGQTKIDLPPPDVFPGRPALPPAGQGAARIEAQRREQRAKKIFIAARARLRALLLLYWFT